MFAIDLEEVRGSKKRLKLNNKFARALVDETFYDVLLNLEDIYTRYKTCRTELKASGSLIDASHCAMDQKNTGSSGI